MPVEIEMVDVENILSNGAKGIGRVRVFDWPDSDGYIYNEGDHEDGWDLYVVYNPFGGDTMTLSKESDHLLIDNLNKDGTHEVVIGFAHELASLHLYDKLKISWYYANALSDPSIEAEGVDELDISGVEEGFYIRVNLTKEMGVMTAFLVVADVLEDSYDSYEKRKQLFQDGGAYYVKIYKVWLE